MSAGITVLPRRPTTSRRGRLDSAAGADGSETAALDDERGVVNQGSAVTRQEARALEQYRDDCLRRDPADGQGDEEAAGKRRASACQSPSMRARHGAAGSDSFRLGISSAPCGTVTDEPLKLADRLGAPAEVLARGTPRRPR